MNMKKLFRFKTHVLFHITFFQCVPYQKVYFIFSMASTQIHALPSLTTKHFLSIDPGTRIVDIVKELIENSIDSNCKNISISLDRAGFNSLKVLDDGCGISNDSIKNSCKTFHTSKINTIDDIFNIKTFGFHGLSLANFSCISKVIIKSKTINDDDAICGKFLYNVPLSLHHCNFFYESGTEVELLNIYNNIPEYRKAVYEINKVVNKIYHIVVKYAISFPNISFVLKSDQLPIFQYTAPHDADIFSVLRAFNQKGNFEVRKFELQTYFMNFTIYVSCLQSELLPKAIYIQNKLVSISSLKDKLTSIFNNSSDIWFHQKLSFFIFASLKGNVYLENDKMTEYLNFITKRYFSEKEALFFENLLKDINNCEYKKFEVYVKNQHYNSIPIIPSIPTSEIYACSNQSNDDPKKQIISPLSKGKRLKRASSVPSKQGKDYQDVSETSNKKKRRLKKTIQNEVLHMNTRKIQTQAISGQIQPMTNVITPQNMANQNYQINTIQQQVPKQPVIQQKIHNPQPKKMLPPIDKLISKSNEINGNQPFIHHTVLTPNPIPQNKNPKPRTRKSKPNDMS